LITRMCVVCRGKIDRSEMGRFVCKNGEIGVFEGIGRSFYVCKSCINSPKLGKIIQKICKIDKNKINNVISKIKETKFYED